MKQSTSSPFEARNIQEFFTGRQSSLAELKQWGTNGGLMVVAGPAGVGKTTLVRMYTLISKADFDRQIFVEGRMFQSVDTVLPYISSQLGIEPSINRPPSGFQLDPTNLLFELSEGRLSNKKILIVIDGLDEIALDDHLGDLLLQISFKGSDKTRWLFTTRNGRFTRLSSGRPLYPLHDFRLLELRGFDQSEVEQFLAKRFGPANLNSFQAIHNLAVHDVAGNPLLLSIIGGLLAKGESFDQILSGLSGQLAEGYSNLLLVPGKEGFTVFPVNQLPPQELVTPSSFLLSTAPYIQIFRLSRFWRSQLEEFEALINNPNVRESEIQYFFEQYPEFLKGIDYDKVVAHPILERAEDEGNLIPDFILQPTDKTFADIVDLKLPSEPIIVGRKDRLHFSAAVSEAIAQVREYRDYFEDPLRRKTVLQRYGLTSYRPSVSVIIGRRPSDLPEEKLKQVADLIPGYTHIVTYDQLFQKMNKIAQMYTI
jgi:energy-coupling factor transporter ATP-binding protein EcfA2